MGHRLWSLADLKRISARLLSVTNRWERILEQKPRPLAEHLLAEVASLLAKDLATWPPAVESLDPATGFKFAPLLAEGHARPSSKVFAEALKVAGWELTRELEPVDDYMRNRRYLEHGLAPDDKLALLFLSRLFVEKMLSLAEATEGRITRAQLVDCLHRCGELLRAANP